MRRASVTAVLALGVYAALVVGLTWPLAPNAATHVADTSRECRYDMLYMVAVVGHESRALLGGPARFVDLNIYHPASRALWYGDTGFSLLPYFFPTFALTGNPALAINLAWLGCLALTAWTLHLVIFLWIGSNLAGFVAGVTFLVTPWVQWTFIPSAPSYSVLQYFPLIIYLAATPARSFLAALKLLPLVVLQCLADVAYVAPAVVGPLGVLALIRLARPSTRAAGARLLGVLVLSLVVLSPVYAAHRAVSLEIPDIEQHSVWWEEGQTTHLVFTEFPWGPFRIGPASLPAGAWALVAIGAISLAMRAWRGGGGEVKQPWAHAALWSVVGLASSITPTVVWGADSIHLPHHLLELWTPLYQFIRVPVRLAVATLIGMSLLCGLAFAEVVQRLPRAGLRAGLGRFVPSVLVLLVAAAMYSSPLADRPRTAPLGAYPIAEAIPGDTPVLKSLREVSGPILELPIGRLEANRPKMINRLFEYDTPIFHARAMYRSIFHDHPLLNGFSGYWPVDFPNRMALARRLPEPDALTALREQTGLALILVHTQDLGKSERDACAVIPNAKHLRACAEDFGARERAEWLAAARGERADLRLVARDGGDLLFAVNP